MLKQNTLIVANATQRVGARTLIIGMAGQLSLVTQKLSYAGKMYVSTLKGTSTELLNQIAMTDKLTLKEKELIWSKWKLTDAEHAGQRALHQNAVQMK